MAGRKMRHELELTGEKAYTQGMKNIEAGLKGITSKQALLNAEYGKGDSSIAKLVRQQDLLQRKFQLQKEKMEAVCQQYEKVSAAEGENSQRAQQLARDYDYAQAACRRTERELETLGRTMEKASSRTEQFKARMRESGEILEKVGRKASDFGNKMTRYVTTPVTAGLIAMGKGYMDFQDSIAKLDVITKGGVGAENLAKGLLKSSNDVGMAVDQLAEAQYGAISAGIEVADSLEYTANAAKAAKAGFTDVATAVDGSTSVLNAWKMKASEANLVFDKMIMTQDLGKTTLGEIAGGIGQLTGLAPQLGVAFDEIMASTVALTKNGVATSSAFNGLKNIMSGVLKPTSQAKEAAKQMGLEFSASALKSKGLAGFLQDVIEKTGGSEEKFAKLFGSVEGLSAALLLTGTGADDFTMALKEMARASGNTEAAFSKLMATPGERMKKSLNQLKNTGISVGQTLAPSIDLINSLLERLSGTLSELTPEQMQFVTGFLMITAAAGPTIGTIGKITEGIGKFQKLLAKTDGTASKLLGGGQWALVLAAIGAVIAGVILLKRHMDSLSGTSKIKAAFSDIKLDTTGIDAALEEAGQVMHELEILTQAKIKLTEDSLDINAYIAQWLSDGKVETKEQKEDVKKKIAEMLQPVYDGVTEAFAEKKKALDEALASGIISPEQYEAKLEELKSTTDKTKTALDEEKKAYVDYVMTLSANGTKPTEAQLAKLEELRQKIIETGNSILEANSAALGAAKASYSLVASGGGTREDVVKATAYLQTEVVMKKDSAKQLHEQTMADLQNQLDKESDATKKLEITAQMEIANQDYQAQMDQIERGYGEKIAAMFDGLAQKYPEQAAKLKEIAEKQNLYEGILSAVTADTRDSDNDAFQKGLKDAWEKAFPDKQLPELAAHTEEALVSEMESLKQQIAETINGTDYTDVFSDFSASISAGALNGLDLTGVEGTLSGLITAFDLADDGRTVGEQIINGEVEGIKDKQADLNAAILASVTKSNETMRSAQGIHSPSTVWEGYGFNMMAGQAQGLRAGAALVMTQIKVLSSRMTAAGSQSIQGLIDGANSRRAALIATYRGLAQAAMKAVTSTLEIRSPSRVFHRFGAFTAEGMIGGLNEKSSQVQRVMRQMVSFSPSAQTELATQRPVVAAANAPHINVYYTGAVSHRDSRKLSNQMGAYLSSSQAGKGKKNG